MGSEWMVKLYRFLYIYIYVMCVFMVGDGNAWSGHEAWSRFFSPRAAVIYRGRQRGPRM